MDKTSYRLLTLTVSCMLLLSTTAQQAIAWDCSPTPCDEDCENCEETGCESTCIPGYCCEDDNCEECPECDDCKSCNDVTCECESDCAAGQCCDNDDCVDNCPSGCCDDGTCVDTCPDCYECVDGECECTSECCTSLDCKTCYYCTDCQCELPYGSECGEDDPCPGECHTCVASESGEICLCEDDDENCGDCEECVGGNCVDIGCDCTIAGEYHDMAEGTEDDECDNTLTLPLEDPFCYYYNGIKVGNCPYTGPGRNTIGYWKTINNMRFYATYHKSWDNTNDGSDEDEGTKYKYDSVIWRYDCISDTGPSKTGIEHPTVMGGDDGTGSAFEEKYCPPI